MHMPNGDTPSIQRLITDILAACTRADQDTQTDLEPDLPTLTVALNSLLDVLHRVQGDAGATDHQDITEIGEYAIPLVENLAACAAKPGQHDQKDAIDELFLNLGLWVAHQGGQIETLEPVVDAVARIANNSRDTAELEALSDIIRQIIEAVPVIIRQDLEPINPGRPWRVLLLNYCIVATRSHNTGLMEAAFALLTESLPADAPRFFTDGMQQMDALDYPGHVRQVMEKYHRKWNIARSLH